MKKIIAILSLLNLMNSQAASIQEGIFLSPDGCIVKIDQNINDSYTVLYGEYNPDKEVDYSVLKKLSVNNQRSTLIMDDKKSSEVVLDYGVNSVAWTYEKSSKVTELSLLGSNDDGVIESLEIKTYKGGFFKLYKSLADTIICDDFSKVD